MPTYNLASYIFHSINSVIKQTFSKIEFIIIDDGSTDNTSEIVKTFNDSRIRFIRKENTGFVDTLNYGLRIAKYDLISRIDADDLFHPLLLEKQIKFLECNPTIAVLSSWYAVFSEDRVKYIVKTPLTNEKIIKGFLLHSYIQHPSVIYKKNVVLKFGAYRETEIEDYGLWLRMMRSVKFANLPEVLFFYRYRSNSASRINIKNRNKLQYHTQDKYYKSLNKYFIIKDNEEEQFYRGWREFFYGDKKRARYYWLKSKLVYKNLRVFFAFLISFLPENKVILIKELRLRYRLIYMFSYFSNISRFARKHLRNLTEFNKF